MNLILLESDEVQANSTARLSGPRAVHIRTVLRSAVGDGIRIGIIDGLGGRGIVTSVGDRDVELACTFDVVPPSRPAVDLLLAVPRPKVLRRLWAQLAALGVGRIMLTNAARVERHYFDTHVLTAACYRPLLIEGLQQARDTHLPCVSVHRQFRVLVEDELDAWCPGRGRVVADPGSERLLSDAVRRCKGERVLLAVGPEGGWNGFELALLESRGFVPAALGPRALRSDTACVAILAVAHDARRSSPPQL